MFLNQENRNRKQKRVFPTFQDKKHILIFWIHQKRRKRETELKRRIKKKTGYKTRNHFSRHRKRPNMEKKAQEKRKQRKRSFFVVKRRKIVSRKSKTFFHKEFDI